MFACMAKQWQEMDLSLEWLSVFVEDCLTSSGNCLPSAAAAASDIKTTSTTKAAPKPTNTQKTPPSLQKFVVPGKARSKRKRSTAIARTKTNPFTFWSKKLYPHDQNLNLVSSEPPLLNQGTWLADSELMVPKKEEKSELCRKVATSTYCDNNGDSSPKEALENGNGQQQQQQPRRCSHCLSQKTPQWRAGPLGPKTLCNACGVRYKSGRLLPEYRPAKSPTFVSYLHSNSHKKVIEMRMTTVASVHPEQ